MKPTSLKPFLLSAFLLPGLGQLYKGDRIKGVILLLLVNIFLLSAVFIILKSLGPVLLAARTAGVTETANVLHSLGERSPGARWLLYGFSAVWLYSAIDALLAPDKKPE
jgi:TM2 domain-containing membrane protein YozV